jgi:hypothetical protein
MDPCPASAEGSHGEEGVSDLDPMEVYLRWGQSHDPRLLPYLLDALQWSRASEDGARGARPGASAERTSSPSANVSRKNHWNLNGAIQAVLTQAVRPQNDRKSRRAFPVFQ